MRNGLPSSALLSELDRLLALVEDLAGFPLRVDELSFITASVDVGLVGCPLLSALQHQLGGSQLLCEGERPL